MVPRGAPGLSRPNTESKDMNCKNSTCVFALAAAAVVGAVGFGFVSSAKSQDDGMQGGNPEAMMAEWVKANAPGKEHAMLLKNMVGSWRAKTTFWPAPGAPATTTDATAEVMPMFGGRFVEVQYSGEMMGQPFNGRSFAGFNNASKSFQSIWFDSSSTGMMVNTGTKTSDNALTWTGSYVDPMTNQQVSTRCVDTFTNDAWTFEMFETASDGTERKTMEIVYTRWDAKAEAAEAERLRDAQKKIEQMNNGGR
jgi:hypothetical protein